LGAGWVGILTVELHFPENHSLKGKRKELLSVKAQLQRRFGASVAEVDHHELWQRARLTLSCVSRGYREVEIEFFTSELEAGRALIEQTARVVPVGPTRFLRRPGVTETEELDDDLFRITARCAVAVGREWLADDLLPSLIKERAASGLLLIGPIITFVDDQALQSFTRAMGAGENRGPATRRRRLRRRQPTPPAPGDDTPWPPTAPT